MESHRTQLSTCVAALPGDVILHLQLSIKTRVLNTASWKEVSYLQFVQGQVAKVAIHLGVVQGLSRALQKGGTQGKCLQVAIFCHLIHMQKIVDCSQAVECNQLLQLVSWKRVADTVSLQHTRNTSPVQHAETLRDTTAWGHGCLHKETLGLKMVQRKQSHGQDC